MPLGFPSLSHGSVAFGFFNIRSDMLLLEKRFFFATDFCRWLTELSAGEDGERVEVSWPVWVIDRPSDIGDLHGAIAGVRHVGFIGETYRRYPFPAAQRDFKQQPEGDGTQEEFAEMIAPWARREETAVVAERAASRVRIGDVELTLATFKELVRYVWRGGFPRWRDEIRPPYVAEMREHLAGSAHWLFDGLDWQV